MKYRALAVSLIGLCIATAFADGHTTSTTPKAQPPADKPITIAANQSTLVLNLKANATTGYSWYLKHFSHQYFALKDYHYEGPVSELIGAPGRAIFTFTVKPAFHKAPIFTNIDLTYMRPFDANSAVDKVLTIVSIPDDTTDNTQAPAANLSAQKATPQQKAQAPAMSNSQIDQGIHHVAKQVQRTEQPKPGDQSWLSLGEHGTLDKPVSAPMTPETNAQTINSIAPVNKGTAIQAPKPQAQKNPNNWLSVDQ